MSNFHKWAFQKRLMKVPYQQEIGFSNIWIIIKKTPKLLIIFIHENIVYLDLQAPPNLHILKLHTLFVLLYQS